MSGILSRPGPRPGILSDGARLLRSGLATGGVATTNEQFAAWLARCEETVRARVERVPLAELKGWHFTEGYGVLAHDSGKFFSVEGTDITRTGPRTLSWQQPLINQPEVGILGLLAKEFDGVLHFLMQAKVEPGNRRQLQLSPTVQATRSNYTKVHGGASTPYLEHFLPAGRGRVVADVLQSEQGTWFLGKRNRNMVVETTAEVPVRDTFCWLTFGQIRRLMTEPNLINMDSRTVLACLPMAVSGWPDDLVDDAPDPVYAAGLRRSFQAGGTDGRHTDVEILSWLNDVRTETDLRVDRVPLSALRDWRVSDEEIAHREGKHFKVIGVSVESGRREVAAWSQPLLAPCDTGVVAFLTAHVDGVPHILMRASVEPGFRDVVELGPTVQCNPLNYADAPPERRPPFLDHVLAVTGTVRYDVVLSEEGGRFHHAECRYMVVECDDPEALQPPPEFRWMTVRQVLAMRQHSNYLNVQTRSLLACLGSLW
ncbi:NDP-hexose 2,3-dehydratase family protein [Streptomyces olivaceus]|uniref:NDP-hexose 2,3-dehydratase family protein n=1 Tax=Streptomyces olivaceus TaxID=47716 RepID=UPI001CCB75AE|nr:NDP-hexose 2,3-dehydratase family protein [Streptomyces olivaceus]MBZ6253501.1 NDP-hexose 2,3-dehydratase family protein [Streptomyces olivaceus]